MQHGAYATSQLKKRFKKRWIRRCASIIGIMLVIMAIYGCSAHSKSHVESSAVSNTEYHNLQSRIVRIEADNERLQQRLQAMATEQERLSRQLAIYEQKMNKRLHEVPPVREIVRIEPVQATTTDTNDAYPTSVSPNESHGKEIIVSDAKIKRYFGRTGSNSYRHTRTTDRTHKAYDRVVYGDTLPVSSKVQTSQTTHGKTSSDDTHGEEDRMSIYRQGISSYRKGKYAEAKMHFVTFLVRGGKSGYNDNANFWIGQSKLSMGDLSGARKSFERVISDYPRSEKRADAMIAKSQVLYMQGAHNAAKSQLAEVIKVYPGTHAAEKARQRQDSIR